VSLETEPEYDEFGDPIPGAEAMKSAAPDEAPEKPKKKPSAFPEVPDPWKVGIDPTVWTTLTDGQRRLAQMVAKVRDEAHRRRGVERARQAAFFTEPNAEIEREAAQWDEVAETIRLLLVCEPEMREVFKAAIRQGRHNRRGVGFL
jgi:hypothetical protein